MTVRNHKVIKIHPDYKVVQWTGLESGDEGDVAELADFPDKTIQIEGGTISDEVSIKGTNNSSFLTLTDNQSNPIVFSDEGSAWSLENYYKIKPVVADVVGTATGITVTILAAR